MSRQTNTSFLKVIEEVQTAIEGEIRYPLGLSLMKIDDQVKTELLDLEGFEIAEFANTYSMTDLPSKERFREAEFWLVYYDSLNGAFYEPWNAFRSGIRKTSKYGEWWDINGLEVHIGWNHEGAFLTVMVGENDNDYATLVWDKREGELKERYGDRKVQLVNAHGKLPRIHIDFSDMPVSWLLTASAEDKTAHAKLLHNGLNDLREMMEYALDEVTKSIELTQQIHVKEE